MEEIKLKVKIGDTKIVKIGNNIKRLIVGTDRRGKLKWIDYPKRYY